MQEDIAMTIDCSRLSGAEVTSISSVPPNWIGPETLKLHDKALISHEIPSMGLNFGALTYIGVETFCPLEICPRLMTNDPKGSNLTAGKTIRYNTICIEISIISTWRAPDIEIVVAESTMRCEEGDRVKLPTMLTLLVFVKFSTFSEENKWGNY